MKEKTLIYQGYLNNHFCFKDENGKTMKFTKSRNDLIREFQLFEKANVNRRFLVKFFVLSSDFWDQFIISDIMVSD